MRTRTQACLLLLVVFLLNYGETAAGTWARNNGHLDSTRPYMVAHALHEVEGSIGFTHQNKVNPIVIYGYSIAYFFVFPLLALAVGWALATQAEFRGFQVFCSAIAIDYFLSLPFFLAFPVVERWADPDNSAMLLSDLWSSNLIEKIRPISGLENSFPSFHVSLSTVIVVTWYLFSSRLRIPVLALALTVIVSTFALGVHWLLDIAAGLGVGFLSVGLAVRVTELAESYRRKTSTGSMALSS